MQFKKHKTGPRRCPIGECSGNLLVTLNMGKRIMTETCTVCDRNKIKPIKLMIKYEND